MSSSWSVTVHYSTLKVLRRSGVKKHRSSPCSSGTGARDHMYISYVAVGKPELWFCKCSVSVVVFVEMSGRWLDERGMASRRRKQETPAWRLVSGL